MFPISSNGVFEDPSIFFEQDNFLEDLLADCPIPKSNDNTDEKGVQKRPRKVSSSKQVEENNEGGSDSKKKIAHRFTEKQRRQEMSALYASLRSLLPLELVKGKRAISDHMQQAVNYINDMKKKLEELQSRRDELRKLCNVASTSAAAEFDFDPNTNVGDSPRCVKINLFREGMMEILISSNLNSKNLPLSKVLADLLGRQLDVVNCVSTTTASCYLHKIHIELNDSTSIDLPELQEQLENLIRFA